MQEVQGRRVETTATSIAILDVIQERGSVRIEALSEELELANSTVHGHLATLQENEFVVKQGQNYRLGLKLFNLGESAKHRNPHHRLVEEKIKEFSAETREEIDFSVEENGRTIVLFDEIGNATGPGFQVGDYFYMNTNAAGKALLAEFDTERIERVIDAWGLPKETEHTITERSRLMEELDEVRDQGYAINNKENFEGIRAIGSSVHTPEGALLGAIAISGPAYRLSVDDLHDLAPVLDRYVREIESELPNTDSAGSRIRQRDT